ncbi:MAG: DUF1653 domain-containing protein [Candidatus Gracilibacteria bacterium]|nr:DUF1653 domain-containing protein [Candidatus Gracilibacteria bacterium]
MKVIGIAKHSETLEDVVVYIHLGKDSIGRENSLWVRPLEMFKGMTNKNGESIKRFEYVGE